MTAFVLGPTRAHIVEWRDDGHGYDTLCSRYKHRYHGHDYVPQGKPWPVRYVGMEGHDRTKPWCPDCVANVRRRVAMYTEHVLNGVSHTPTTR